MEKIGIVILNYKNWKITVKCINSVLKSSNSDYFHIFVIDNGSNNDSIRLIKDNFLNLSNISYFELKQNIGFANGNNYGAMKCYDFGLNYCLFLNSDVFLSFNSIDILYSIFNDRSDAVIVGPQILNRDHILTNSSLCKKTRLIDSLGIFTFLKPKRIDESKVDICEPVYSVSGCCFMVDLIKFKSIGMFDENTFLYNEENILAEKVNLSNFKEYFTSKTYVIHEHAVSSGGKNDFVYIELLKSTLYYWYQYRNYHVFGLYFILFAWIVKTEVVKFKGNDVHPLKIFKEGVNYLQNSLNI